jgi:hypothetical protein
MEHVGSTSTALRHSASELLQIDACARAPIPSATTTSAAAEIARGWSHGRAGAAADRRMAQVKPAPASTAKPRPER